MNGIGGKAHIRSRVLAARNGLSPEERSTQSRQIAERIVGMMAFRHARVVMAYNTFGSEVHTDAFIRVVREGGKRLVLPRIDRGRDCLALYQVDGEHALKAGVWGIREPDPVLCAPVSPGELDFVLTPGVAFDRRGGRIGYGKGYYDRLLASCLEEGGRPWTVAGAFDVQLVDAVPLEEHDVPVHAVATASECIVTNR